MARIFGPFAFPVSLSRTTTWLSSKAITSKKVMLNTDRSFLRGISGVVRFGQITETVIASSIFLWFRSIVARNHRTRRVPLAAVEVAAPAEGGLIRERSTGSVVDTVH